MSIIVWIVIGLIAGGIGGLAIKARGYPLVGYILGGLVGAVAGGIFASFMFGGEFVRNINAATVVEAMLGALALIACLHALPVRSRAR